MLSSWVQKCKSMRRDGATLADLLEVEVQVGPDKVAIIFENTPITYRELDEAANRVANGLIELGVRSGDRVAVHIDNRPDFVKTYLGIMRCGAILVPTNIMYKSNEIEHILRDSGAKVLLILARHSSKVAETVRELPELENVIELGGQPTLDGSIYLDELLADSSSERPQVRKIHLDDLAMILYTSGTTGKAKGAMITHRNVMAVIDNVADLPSFQLVESDVTLLVLPLFHSYALNACLGRSLSFGLTTVLVNRFDAERVFALVEKYQVSVFWGAPPMYFAFVNTPGLDAYNVSSLRATFSGAAALPVAILVRFKEMTGLEIIEGYGLTEAAPTLTINAAGPVNKPGSVGPPIPGVQLRVVDENDRDVTRGEVGEICCQGPNVFKGYWRRERETAEAMRGGWFHTGDLARVDEDGYYYIVDRKKDVVVVSGYNVYPIEVESVIVRHPHVLECAVVGVPHPYQGESVRAFVVPRSQAELTEQEIIEFCGENLAAFKVPKTVVFRDSLPKNATGKILKRMLREQEPKSPS